MRKILAALGLVILTFHTGVILGDAVRTETHQVTTDLFGDTTT